MASKCKEMEKQIEDFTQHNHAKTERKSPVQTKPPHWKMCATPCDQQAAPSNNHH